MISDFMTTTRPCRIGFPLGKAIVYFTLAFFGGLCVPTPTYAGHVSGIDLTYECTNSCTVRVNFRAYRNCSSAIPTISPFNTFAIAADSSCTLPTQIGTWLNVANVEVTPVCPGTPTKCNTPGAALDGIMEHHWIGDFDFCAATCSTYTLAWRSCCRNSAINTISNPLATPIYVGTTFNPFETPCNSSPQFTNPPVAVLCEGQSYIFNQGATDPNGDSLAYLLGPCMVNDTDSVVYLNFTSFSEPLGPDWIVDLDSITGDMTIAPNPNGPSPGGIYNGVLCIFVEEWRNGQLINTIVRDMQVIVAPCPPNTSPFTSGISQVSGAIANGFTLTTCLGATVCADLRFLDPDAGQTQTVWWDLSLAPLGATFVAAGNPTVTDTVVGTLPTARFCWTPTTPGTYTFGVTAIDDACPIFGINQYTYTIHVGEIETLVSDSISGCDSVLFCASPSLGTAPYSYQWSGSGGINVNPNNADSCFNHQFPFSGTYAYQLVVTDSIGCTATALDTVLIPNNVQASAGPDLFTCSNQPIVIGDPPQTNPDLAYSWTPVSLLSNPGQPQPTATISNNGLAPVLQDFVLLLQDSVTKCFDQDTMRLTVFPIPASPFFIPQQTCQGTPVGATYTGTNGPLATYDWTFAQGTPATATGAGPHVVVWNTPGFHEITLTVTENGCVSPVERDTISVIPIPVADIGNVADQCLISNSFNFLNLGSYGSLASFQWTFWPNAAPFVSTAENPAGIVFSTPGPKTAILQITENGCPSVPDTLHFNVTPDPDPNWSVQNPVQCFLGNNFQFAVTGNNDTSATYFWTFADGSPATSTDTLPQVTFLTPGPKAVTMTVTQNGCTSTRTDTIVVAPEPTVSAGPAQEFCQGEGGVTLSASVSNGTAPYYYTWSCALPSLGCGIDSLNDDDPRVNPSASTWYYVEVVDGYGCGSGVDSVLVTVMPKPQVDAGADSTICGLNAPCTVLMPTVGGSPGPYGYQWIPGRGLSDSTARNPCARPDTTTIYTLVVTDSTNGCTSDFNTLDTNSTVQVTVEQVPQVDAGPDISLCQGDSVRLEGIATGAGPAYQYNWTPGNTLSNPFISTPWASPTLTTQYSVVAWSNGCPSLADTVSVVVHTIPTVDAGIDIEICLGETVTLNATVGGDSTANYTFNWAAPPLGNLQDPTLEDPPASPGATTTYYVTASSNWGCTAVDSVTVFLRPTPIAEAGDALSVCLGDSAVLHGSYYYGLTDSVVDPSLIWYAWSPAQSLTDPAVPDPGLLPAASGWYHLQVQHANCQTTDSVLVTVIPQLNAAVGADTSVICAGDSLQLNAGGGLGGPLYTWIPGSGLNDPTAESPRAAPDSSTQYTLILSEAGCADTAGFFLEVLPRPDAEFVHSQAAGCPPLAVSFLETTTDGIARIWDFGDGSPVSNQPDPTWVYTEPGEYPVRLVAIAPGGCADTAEGLRVRVESPPVADFNALPDLPTRLYLPRAEIELRDASLGALTWRWELGDGRQFAERNVRYVYATEGEYFVTLQVENAAGCRALVRKGPIVVLPPDLFIPNVFSPNSDGVNDRFRIEYEGDQPFFLEINDRWGASVHTTRNKLPGWDGRDARDRAVSAGVYFYRIQIGDRAYVGEVTLVR